MSIIKQTKDYLAKTLAGSRFVPQGLFEASEYFRHNGPIKFEFKIENDQHIAISTNFRYGSIVTSGKDVEELEKNIKDAILTSFDIPSSYAKEANILKVGQERGYAFA
ncbi:MAG: hypothetical protein A3J59_03305 [Candidatus Buchananbacteria bacterium RIFCSPHIGHO2_02_FULL_56_16]|uniref:Uncharacterized protein n=1 Tax=Candidatus Buchananbacteria bacterium RIFCSPHIGHO2_02_FULL_56_16 TaxID=1797542 RepID=A0A1G1YII7_9BACT|nr:MAG: hypothetical protein A3J59_03305 [Candidatus Buchananbacteria bacterium RIFCSPHIGHO2_02_FULL_56_16]